MNVCELRKGVTRTAYSVCSKKNTKASMVSGRKKAGEDRWRVVG